MTERLSDVAMLAAPSNRSRIYLDLLERHGLVPDRVLLLDDSSDESAEQQRRAEEKIADVVLPEDPELDVRRTVRRRLEELDVPFSVYDTINPNSEALVDAVSRLHHGIILYSGPGGIILDGDLLTAGPKFLHIHAGKLPDYRGSTTIYYSLLNEAECGVTAFIMNENIDEGPIIAQKVYPPPKDPETIDLYYDPWIRAQLLVDVIFDYQRYGSLSEQPQQPGEGETYFIIHPVLKHITVLSCCVSDSCNEGGDFS